MMHIIMGRMDFEPEKPDGHGATSRWHLPKNSSNGEPDRHGHGINGVVAEAKRHRALPLKTGAAQKGKAKDNL